MVRYVADFETLTTAPTRVWLWGSANIDNLDEVMYGTDIESFLLWCVDKRNIYFHNEKFDASFILDYLLRIGWKESDRKKPNTFKLVMSAGGQMYSLTLFFQGGTTVKIMDSFKKFRMSVAAVAKTFQLEEAKGVIDYAAPRPVGYKPTDEEIKYVWLDVRIVAIALKMQFDKGLSKLTIGADALDHYKRLTPHFKYWFPVFSLDLDAELRPSYKGGWVYCNPDVQYPARDVGHGYSIDVNSLFPYVMYDRPMPYGQPVYYEGEYKHNEEYPLYIARIRVDFTLKDDMLPTVQIKKSLLFVDTEYITDSNGIVELTLTSVDWKLMQEHYYIHEVEFVCGYMFKASTEMFKPYIDYWMEVKANSTGGMRQLAKLMLNNLYGKFGKNPDVTGRTAILENNVVKYQIKEQEFSEPCYLPVAAFTTAWARDMTIRTAQNLKPWFCYSDTDSISVVGISLERLMKLVEIHDSDLGKWALENEFEKARFLRPKRYIKSVSGDVHVTCAGLPKAQQNTVNFDNFYPGLVVPGKLLPKMVVGGTILEENDFTLK